MNFDHPNIQRYHEVKEEATLIKKDGSTKQVAYIAQELIENGELFDYIANSGPFGAPLARYYFK